METGISFTALQGIPKIRARHYLAALVATARPVDAVNGQALVLALVVARNVVNKAEGREVEGLFR